MSLATREQKAVVTDFAGDGAFCSFGRQKNIRERLEENLNKRIRLRTTVEYYGERKRSQFRILIVLICLFAHTKFLLNRLKSKGVYVGIRLSLNVDNNKVVC